MSIGAGTVLRCWCGVDPREASAWRVAKASFYRHASMPAGLAMLDMLYLREARYYTRPTEERDGRLWDTISAAPMSTVHSLARFLVPWLACNVGWALFTDADIMWRADPRDLFRCANDQPDAAVLVVKHRQPDTGARKMDGQIQSPYPRKNWSSVMLVNCGHPAVRALTLEQINTRPGLWLHGFEWLPDELIGELPPEWNHLVGVDSHDPNAKLAHFTLGTPDMPGHEQQPFADEWRSYLQAESNV